MSKQLRIGGDGGGRGRRRPTDSSFKRTWSKKAGAADQIVKVNESGEMSDRYNIAATILRLE